MQRTPIHLVWLKRDLRLSDHRPIFEASQSGPTVVLYVFEPELWAMPEMDRSHFDFIAQSIQDLSQTGVFIRQFVPELAHIPNEYMSSSTGCSERREHPQFRSEFFAGV